jgi:hypothetical protein
MSLNKRQIETLGYLLNTFDINWYSLYDDEYSKYNYLVYLCNNDKKDYIKIRWMTGCRVDNIKLLDVLNGLAFNISVLDNDDYDNFDLDYNEIRRLKKITRRLKTRLEKIIDIPISNFVEDLRSLEL